MQYETVTVYELKYIFLWAQLSGYFTFVLQQVEYWSGTEDAKDGIPI